MFDVLSEAHFEIAAEDSNMLWETASWPKIMAVVLMVLSVARCVRLGNYRAAVATLVLNAIAFVTELQAVVLFFLPVHYYFNVYLAAPRPRVIDFGRAPRLR